MLKPIFYHIHDQSDELAAEMLWKLQLPFASHLTLRAGVTEKHLN